MFVSWLLLQAHSWILCVGFTLAYGSMFLKVWAVYRFATQRKNELQVKIISQVLINREILRANKDVII